MSSNKMYIVHVTAGNYIFDRKIFNSLPEAKYYATQKAKEKVWPFEHAQIYYGSVTSKIYDIDFKKPSDYQDEHILSFS